MDSSIPFGSVDSSEDDRSVGRRNSYDLHNACEAGDVEGLTQLLSSVMKKDGDFNPDQGSDDEEDEVELDERDQDECTPLHLAILHGRLECVKLLLAAGAEILYKCEGSPLLHLALAVGQLPSYESFSLEVLDVLLEAGCDPNGVDDRGCTPLHVCCELGLEKHAAKLLKGEADSFSLVNKMGHLPVHVAVRHPAVLNVLLDAGADSSESSCTAVQRTALHEAAALGVEESVNLLVKAAGAGIGTLLVAQDQFGYTATMLAKRKGFDHIAAYLTAVAAGETPEPLQAEAAPLNMLILAPHQCHFHITHTPTVRGGPEPPPENDGRLKVLTHPRRGILRSTALATCEFLEECEPAPMADVLRVHDWSYVKKVQDTCTRLDGSSSLGYLDGDTAICGGSFTAARHAAGAVLRAVDAVVLGESRHAFCAVRPPGHHAGPSGVVRTGNEPTGSHGFCLLSNVAIGAAYARCVHRDKGIRRVAMLDFDVHHGNGTQACVAATYPTSQTMRFETTFAEGMLKVPHWKPWLDLDADKNEIFLAGTQGYGSRTPEMTDSWFYPGSGGTYDTARAGPALLEPEYAAATVVDKPLEVGPRVVNVGIPGPGARPSAWRRAWCDKIIPALADFRELHQRLPLGHVAWSCMRVPPNSLYPLIEGFDAHKKDDVNCGYVGVEERDYLWVTDAIVQVANECCQGRVVSVLEGGYRIQGGVVSAFARSAATHVGALAAPNGQRWSHSVANQEMFADRPQLNVDPNADAVPEHDNDVEMESGGGDGGEVDGLEMVVDLGGTMHGRTTAGGEPAADATDDDQGRRKRRREPVDYAALNAKLEEEQKAAAAAAAAVAEDKEAP